MRPLAKRLRISPNLLTALGLVPGLLAAFACLVGWFHLALICWFANRFLDGLDGEVARAHDKQTDLGGYLDILADLLVYALIPLCLAAYHDTSGIWLACTFMLSSFYLNVGSWMYLSSILEKEGMGAERLGEKTTVVMPRGLIEGGETVLFFTLFLLFPNRSALLFFLFASLTYLGAVLRVKWAMRALPELSRG